MGAFEHSIDGIGRQIERVRLPGLGTNGGNFLPVVSKLQPAVLEWSSALFKPAVTETGGSEVGCHNRSVKTEEVANHTTEGISQGKDRQRP